MSDDVLSFLKTRKDNCLVRRVERDYFLSQQENIIISSVKSKHISYNFIKTISEWYGEWQGLTQVKMFFVFICFFVTMTINFLSMESFQLYQYSFFVA